MIIGYKYQPSKTGGEVLVFLLNSLARFFAFNDILVTRLAMAFLAYLSGVFRSSILRKSTTLQTSASCCVLLLLLPLLRRSVLNGLIALILELMVSLSY